LIIASPDDYELVFTITKRGVGKCRVLVKPIVFETDTAKIDTFLLSTFELLQTLGLGYYFLSEVAGFR
jgi:hypothetical protein